MDGISPSSSVVAMREWVVVLCLLAGCDASREARASAMAWVDIEEVPADFSRVPVDVGGRSPRVRSPPPGFVSVEEAIPGATLDVRYASANNFTGAPLPGYAADTLWLHEEAASALSKVQAAVEREGMRLRIYDAYRPARASEAMVAWAQAEGRMDLLRDGYIGPRSNHARGNTVDLTLDGPDDAPLEMGTEWDAFERGSHYAEAQGEAMENRRLLRRVMKAEGFEPYAKEWWHFSIPTTRPRLDVPYRHD